MVEFLARYFIEKKKLVVIINKGYKRTYDDIQVAELGYTNKDNKLNIDNFGDESLMLLENFEDITEGRGLLIVSDNKTTGAKFAYKKFKPDIMIIDDGFQHRKLFRDLDIVVIDKNTNGLLLPAGNLREPMKNLSRADIIMLNHKFGELSFKLSKKLMYRLGECRFELDSFRNLNNDVLKKEKFNAMAFCGIGDPDSFKTLLINIGISVVAFIKFPDHHDYSVQDINKLIDIYESSVPNFILTTQKDFVRLSCTKQDKSKECELKKRLISDFPLYYAKINLQISGNSNILLDKLKVLTREQQKV
jgi:tetraacyldisaccharide 4'-kinase